MDKEKEYVCNLYRHDCEYCPFETDQNDEEGNIILECTYEESIKEND